MKNSENKKGKITLGRITSTHGDYISVEIMDEASGCRFVNARMSIEGFGRAITGQGYIDCTFDLCPQNVGMKREVKTVDVESKWTSSRNEPKARAELSKYEVDGWVGRLDDMFNRHRRTKTGYNVTFIRFVEP